MSKMTEFKDQIDLKKLPSHIAVIMDGNGRWAKQHGKPRVFGHKNGVKSVREISEASAELGISYLTLYAFSTENWSRPIFEVNALMSLLVETVFKEIGTLNENNIKLNYIGDIKSLPKKSYEALLRGIESTKNNTRMTLTLALNYSARWELKDAVRQIATEVKKGNINPEEIDESTIENYLTTKGIPDPELLIRTSGEQRISNFLLWQSAYAEFHFTKVLWPDFRKDHLYQAITDFQHRERRFGKISEQVEP